MESLLAILLAHPSLVSDDGDFPFDGVLGKLPPPNNSIFFRPIILFKS